MKNLIQQSTQFLKDAYAELRKVTWLSRKEVIGTTIVVIIFVILVALYVGFIDWILAGVLGVIFK